VFGRKESSWEAREEGREAENRVRWPQKGINKKRRKDVLTAESKSAGQGKKKLF